MILTLWLMTLTIIMGLLGLVSFPDQPLHSLFYLVVVVLLLSTILLFFNIWGFYSTQTLGFFLILMLMPLTSIMALMSPMVFHTMPMVSLLCLVGVTFSLSAMLFICYLGGFYSTNTLGLTFIMMLMTSALIIGLLGLETSRLCLCPMTSSLCMSWMISALTADLLFACIWACSHEPKHDTQ